MYAVPGEVFSYPDLHFRLRQRKPYQRRGPMLHYVSCRLNNFTTTGTRTTVGDVYGTLF